MLLELLPALLIALCALCGGCALLHRWGAPNPSERLVLAWALGFALHGTLTLLVGLWRFDPLTLVGVDIILLFVGARPLWQMLRALGVGARAAWASLRATWLRLALLGALLGFALLNVLGAATLPLDGDALRYQLAAPQHWLHEGAVGLTLGIPYASFPMLAQMSYAHALAFGARAAPALLHALWAAVFALGVYVATDRGQGTGDRGQGDRETRGNADHPLTRSPAHPLTRSPAHPLTRSPAHPLLAALLFLSLTDVSAEAKLPRVDLAVGLWGWGAAWCWLRWRALDCGGQADRSAARGWLCCAGLLAGAAAAGKYTGLIAALVTGALLCADTLRRRAHARDLLLFSACAALVAAPWYLKNWWLTGNPIFPFGAALLGGPLPPQVLAQAAAAAGSYAPISRTPLNLLLTPLLLIFDNGQFASGRIGPLWLLLPLVARVRPRPAWTRAALAWGLLFAPLWFWTSPLVRFAFPVLALWSPLLARVISGQGTGDREQGTEDRGQRIGDSTQGTGNNKSGLTPSPAHPFTRAPLHPRTRSLLPIITAVWLLFAFASSAARALPALPFALGMRAPEVVLAAAPRVDGPYTFADLQRASAVSGALLVFDTAGFYIARPATLAGDLGSDPAATLDARYGGAACAVVYVLLPDAVASDLDAWVAARARPWVARHAQTVIYRRGDVALYRVDGCTRRQGSGVRGQM